MMIGFGGSISIQEQASSFGSVAKFEQSVFQIAGGEIRFKR
jgi:hypothetical protein